MEGIGMILFATDFDGTLNQMGVSRKTLNAIKEFREAGHKFGIVTGRTLDLMEPEVKLYNIPLDYLIGANGGVIQVEGKILQNAFIEFEVVEKILQIAREKDIANIGISNGYKYGNIRTKISFSIVKFIKSLGFMLKRVNSKEILDNKKVTTIFLHDDPDRIAGILDTIQAIDGVEVYVNNLEYMDIVAKGVSKANAVETLQEHFQASEAYVIGDSMNDYPMIERFHGFCVDNACAEIKEIASASFKEVGDAINYVMEVNKNEEK